MCNDQDILNCYFVPGTLYRAFIPRERLALWIDVALLRRMDRDSTHSWIAKFFYKVFAVGTNRADKVGQIKAVLITQSSVYQSEELGVSYGHEAV
jgi:hypothetical protein